MPLTDITASTIQSSNVKDGPKDPEPQPQAKTILQNMVSKELCFLASKQQHTARIGYTLELDRWLRTLSILQILSFTALVDKQFSSFEIACQLFDHLTLPYIHGKGKVVPRFPLMERTNR